MNQKDKFTIVRDDDEGDREVRPEVRPPRRQTMPPSGPLSVFRGAAGVRLMFMCLLLLGVIWAMNYSGQPESWNWLFRFDQVEIPNQSADVDSGKIDSGGFRNPDFSEREKGERESEKEGRKEGKKGNADGGESQPTDSGDGVFLPAVHHSVKQAKVYFWKQSLERLDGVEQARLFNLVNCASKQKPLPVGATAMSIRVFSKVNKWHESFTGTLASGNNPMPEFETSWEQSVKPAMQAILDDKADQGFLDDELRQLPELVESAANMLVEDNTSVGRTRESYAWFAAWNRVFDSPIDMSTKNPATVTQLLSQPDSWRGQIISISGTALRAEKVEASHNSLGIERYYVIWIKPDHPSSYPWCVYTLMAPDSLVGESSEGMQAIDVRVVTNARFFKNRLFDAGEAAYAPLLMTASVTEFQPPVSADNAMKKFQIPGWNLIILTIGIVGVMASMIAWTAWRTTLGGRTRALPKSERLEQRFTLLQDDERVETTAEKLKKMGETIDDAPQDEHFE